ncbi:hypothetical protein [Roseobacter sp. HKCCA0434]|uniref:hypothetical protein n=1 Tax=Roseobacter sp. HKCCA0434 TaxID=3079297 RepID=UPI002905D2B4|nr:hypothetical protein [Roseobacter sp. HKCCA0434]
MPQTPFARPAFVMASTLSLALIFALLDELYGATPGILHEGGGVELASATLYFVGVALRLHLRGLADWQVPVAMLFMGLRELDFDKAFTSEGVFQLRLYSGDNPIWEKAIGLVVVIVLLVALYRLARYQLPAWVRGVLSLRLWAWTFGIAGFLGVVSKTFDGLARKLEPLGIEISEALSRGTSRTEEALELWLAILIVQVVVLAARRD